MPALIGAAKSIGIGPKGYSFDATARISHHTINWIGDPLPQRADLAATDNNTPREAQKLLRVHIQSM